MTRIRCSALLSTLLLALLATACGDGDPEPQPSPAAAAEEETPAPSDASEGVAYEPAFPEDVSAEGLSEEDVAQQEGSRSHGDDEHSHGDDTHKHDGGETHDDHDH